MKKHGLPGKVLTVLIVLMKLADSEQVEQVKNDKIQEESAKIASKSKSSN